MDTQGEFDWIERIAREAGPPPPDTLGIGDDCALLRCGPRTLALTKDVLAEDVHFRRRWMSPYFLGRKSLAVNLSDLAAMGARPHSCLLGLSLPAQGRRRVADAFLKGFLEESRRWDCRLIGGDLSGSRSLHVSVTALGVVESPPAARRDAAQPGDLILLIGALGLARSGLEMVEKADCRGLEDLGRLEDLAGWAKGPFQFACLKALLCPEPQLEAGAWLRENGLVNAMIDVSDGLGADLLHVARRSGLAAALEIDLLTPLRRVGEETLSLDALLNGGEDYALLFTASRAQWNRLREEYPPGLPTLRRVGTMKKGTPGLFLKDDSGLRECEPRGFDHFQ